MTTCRLKERERTRELDVRQVKVYAFVESIREPYDRVTTLSCVSEVSGLVPLNQKGKAEHRSYVILNIIFGYCAGLRLTSENLICFNLFFLNKFSQPFLMQTHTQPVLEWKSVG